MSNQQTTTTSSTSSSFRLNPSANEFVPSFAVNSNSSTSNSSNHNPTSNNYNNNYNSNRYHQNNNHYHQQQQHQHHYNNNQRYYNNNNNNNNYYNNNNNKRDNNNYYNNNYNNNNSSANPIYNNPNQTDVDPFEMEARCEAVVEILQDDQVRDHLNPDPEPRQQQQQIQAPDLNDDNLDQCEDEEEMLEMMAMQEECRLEMMKFYIQSQNPTLFENIYHDVSYPDGCKPDQPQSNTNTTSTTSTTSQSSSASTAPASTASSTTADLKDSIVNNLDSKSDDFVPKKLENMTLKE